MCDLRLFMPLLKLVEPEGNKEEKLVNSDIGLALGFSVHEFDEMKTPEVVKFRRNIFNCVSEIVQVWSPSVSVLQFHAIFISWLQLFFNSARRLHLLSLLVQPSFSHVVPMPSPIQVLSRPNVA